MSAGGKIAYQPTVDWRKPQAASQPTVVRPVPRRPRRRRAWSLGLLTGACLALAAAAVAAPVAARDIARHGAGAGAGYTFHTYDNSSDPAFNRLLGINSGGVVAGYLGSGALGHPNQGYQLLPGGRGDYVNENVPGAAQTQVTGLNDTGITVGFWSDENNAYLPNDSFGFYAVRGSSFHVVDFPTRDNASPPVDQLLGVNDHGVAVGFYTNSQGSNRGYEYNIGTRTFSRVLVPGAPRMGRGPSLTAAAINNHGDVAGFYTAGDGATVGFVKMAGGRFITLAYPGASMTQALGINDGGEVVGTYEVATGASCWTHGFTWRAGHGFTAVDDPHGVDTTSINGVNGAGDLVGFYADARGNTHGLLALPRR
ncbi:MAG TPA: hypothetical protein VEG33_20080 [Streptosporangiaceae bacterium]|nr:hypothetical protein [Streptosporangiaceae bacterium]